MWKYGRVVQCQGQLLFKFAGRNLGSVEVEGTSMDFFMWMKLETTRPTTAYHRIPSELIHSICQDTQQSLYRTLRGGVGLIHVEKSGSNFFTPICQALCNLPEGNLYNSFCHEVATHFFFRVKPELWRTPSVASRFVKDQAGFLLETLVSTCSSTTRMGEGRRSAGLHSERA